jgi:hypothetical protein
VARSRHAARSPEIQTILVRSERDECARTGDLQIERPSWGPPTEPQAESYAVCAGCACYRGPHRRRDRLRTPSAAGQLHHGSGGAQGALADNGLALAKLAHVAAVSPGVGVRTQVPAGKSNWYTQVSGVAPTFTYIRQWHLASGSFFTDADVASSAKVCVLGQTVVANLFPDGQSPLGKTVLVRNVPFTVIGTLAVRGQSSIDVDRRILRLLSCFKGCAPQSDRRIAPQSDRRIAL